MMTEMCSQRIGILLREESKTTAGGDIGESTAYKIENYIILAARIERMVFSCLDWGIARVAAVSRHLCFRTRNKKRNLAHFLKTLVDTR